MNETPGSTSVARTDTLFDALGGRETLARVHHALYNKLYGHPWLKQFFRDRTQEHQENQQTDFMMRALGGPSVYGGRLPKAAHEHIYITEEVFRLRHELLEQSLKECGVPDDLAKRWLHIDFCFMAAIVKDRPDECRKRFTTDEIIAVDKP